MAPVRKTSAPLRIAGDAARAVGSVRMRDIADQAGVSRATVSFVLNDKHRDVGISEETRGRVLAAAAELGYRRNELAHAMVTGKRRVLGFVVANPESEVAGRILAGVLEAAEERDLFVKVLSPEKARDPGSVIARCAELRLAGVLALYMGDVWVRELQAEMARHGIPVAVLDSSFPQPQGLRLLSDDAAGCRAVVEHLTGLGHRRIAFVSGSRTSGAASGRERGFRAAMAEFELPVPDEAVVYGDWHEDRIESVTRGLFADVAPAGRPTALFCADDKTAFVACRTLRALGLSVPSDVSVVGFADLVMARYGDPPLTTVAQPFREIGRASVEYLAASGEGAPASGDILLRTNLVVRQSTAPPGADS